MLFLYYYFLSIDLCFFFFFFSSRRRHTRLVSDWSSDVCSSDLAYQGLAEGYRRTTQSAEHLVERLFRQNPLPYENIRQRWRSEERRVGKECRSRWSPYH